MIYVLSGDARCNISWLTPTDPNYLKMIISEWVWGNVSLRGYAFDRQTQVSLYI